MPPRYKRRSRQRHRLSLRVLYPRKLSSSFLGLVDFFVSSKKFLPEKMKKTTFIRLSPNNLYLRR